MSWLLSGLFILQRLGLVLARLGLLLLAWPLSVIAGAAWWLAMALQAPARKLFDKAETLR